MKYAIATDGEWITPIMRGYKMRCCDCGLVHKINFRVIRWGRGFKVVFQPSRDIRATSACRRKKRK